MTSVSCHVTGGVLENMRPVKSAGKHAKVAKRVKLQPITKVLPSAGNYVTCGNRFQGLTSAKRGKVCNWC